MGLTWRDLVSSAALIAIILTFFAYRVVTGAPLVRKRRVGEHRRPRPLGHAARWLRPSICTPASCPGWA